MKVMNAPSNRRLTLLSLAAITAFGFSSCQFSEFLIDAGTIAIDYERDRKQHNLLKKHLENGGAFYGTQPVDYSSPMMPSNQFGSVMTYSPQGFSPY